uniref:Cytochrome P450 n=1 Tax=Mycena chlorophos TaxID=658473 RepID=A0ABQ0LYJ4_MYCCL|nr:cytochrome P450 [Mycena chlorophos]
MAAAIVLASALILWVVWLAFKRFRSPGSALPLPPGPKPDFLLGNLRHLPVENAGEVFREMSKEYGDVMYMKVPGKSPIVILSSLLAAQDLLEKRSAIYSDRPRFALFELFGFGTATTLLPYGKRLMKHRQMHNAYLSKQTCVNHQSMQAMEAQNLIQNLLASPPEEYEIYMNRFAISIITQILLGHQVHSKDDEFVKLSQTVMAAVVQSGPPGGTIIDLLPFLRKFPSWLPGMQPAQIAYHWQPVVRHMHNILLSTARDMQAAGTAVSSYVPHFLEMMQDQDGNLSAEDETDIKSSAVAMFSAGEVTTWGLVSTFVLAMLLYPACQKQARDELDALLGKGSMPTFQDRPHLPYLECIYEEVFRWAPTAPLGLPHRVTEEDTYRGMRIPAGSTVIANLSAMMHDEQFYHQPTKFIPERYLPAPKGHGEPRFVAKFGFGRRVCTGQYLAENSVWIAMATILASCEIDFALDNSGNPIIPEFEMVHGVTSHPKPYECVIRSRK